MVLCGSCHPLFLCVMSRRKSALVQILKRATDEKEEVSVSKEIDNACAEGVTESGCFSVRGIKSSLNALMEVANAEEFDRDKFFSMFNDFYSAVMAPARRSKGAFHPSQLMDGCQRAMAYELIGAEATPLASTISGTLQRTFDVGTWYHLYIQNILYKIGLLEQAEVPVINDEKRICGHADGVFKEKVFGEKVVLEIKTMNSWTYQRAVFAPFKKHEFQASLYARELGAKKILFLYINKDTSEIKDFLVPLNAEQLKIADKKMGDVLECIENDELPTRVCGDKFCDAAISCCYANQCFK